MNQSIFHLCEDLQRAMKRHRGQPLPMDTKLKIVSELMQQRRERAALQATAGTRRRRRRTTTNQTSIARRHAVALSTVSKINKLLTQLLLSREQSATAATAATTTVAIASNGTAPTTTSFFNQVVSVLTDKVRGGDRESRAARSKLGANDGRVALYIEELFENIAPRRRNDLSVCQIAIATIRPDINNSFAIGAFRALTCSSRKPVFCRVCCFVQEENNQFIAIGLNSRASDLLFCNHTHMQIEVAGSNQ